MGSDKEKSLFNRQSDMDNINKIPVLEAHLSSIKETLVEFKEGWKDFKVEIAPHIADVPIIKKDVSWLKAIFWKFEVPIFLSIAGALIVLAIKVIFKN